MIILSLPPIIKHLEAFSVFVDNRIKKIDEKNYEIFSSDFSKIYNVYFEKINEKEFLVYSNDNGTIIKKYIGYPIIAVLIDKNILELSKNFNLLKGIKWKELNEKFKNYQKVIEFLEEKIEKDKFKEIMDCALRNQEKLKKLRFYLKV
ncbi:MAG: hypothetical protein QXQ19_02555 [Candidatus Aenigmatarchaeota archaeon]